MIRKTAADDADRVAEIHTEGWRQAYRGIIADSFLFGKLSVCRRAGNIRKELELGQGESYVAERGGVVAGFVVMGLSRDDDKRGEGNFELWAVYTEPAMKRSGLGAEMLAFCEAEAARRGMREVSLWVLERNASARAFYEKHGYRPDGSVKVLERLPSADGVQIAEIRYVKKLLAQFGAGGLAGGGPVLVKRQANMGDKVFKVYVTRRIPEAGLELLRKSCDVEVNPEDRPLTRAELLEKVKGRDGIITLLTDRVDAEVLDAAAGAKGFANCAVGFDNLDIAAATARKMPLSNTPGVLTLAAAEMAWALLFAAGRRVVESDKAMRSGGWQGWGPLQFIGGDVSGKTLGVVGAGRIGAAMAMMSKGFGMKVLYADDAPNPRLEAELGARHVGLAELLKDSDYVSLHVPLTPVTRHLIDAEALALMKPTAYLINTARGPVVDEAALVKALKERRIAGAALDVYEFEPRLAPGLAELDNAVLTAHTASATRSSRDGMALKAAENLLAMMSGARPPDCLNPEIYK